MNVPRTSIVVRTSWICVSTQNSRSANISCSEALRTCMQHCGSGCQVIFESDLVSAGPQGWLITRAISTRFFVVSLIFLQHHGLELLLCDKSAFRVRRHLPKQRCMIIYRVTLPQSHIVCLVVILDLYVSFPDRTLSLYHAFLFPTSSSRCVDIRSLRIKKRRYLVSPC